MKNLNEINFEAGGELPPTVSTREAGLVKGSLPFFIGEGLCDPLPAFTIGVAKHIEGEACMGSHGLDDFTETVICGFCGGETDVGVDGNGGEALRCLSCDNEVDIEQGRNSVIQFIKDEHMRQLQGKAAAIGDRFPWIKVENQTVTQPDYLFVLKPRDQ